MVLFCEIIILLSPGYVMEAGDCGLMVEFTHKISFCDVMLCEILKISSGALSYVMSEDLI